MEKYYTYTNPVSTPVITSPKPTPSPTKQELEKRKRYIQTNAENIFKHEQLYSKEIEKELNQFENAISNIMNSFDFSKKNGNSIYPLRHFKNYVRFSFVYFPNVKVFNTLVSQDTRDSISKKIDEYLNQYYGFQFNTAHAYSATQYDHEHQSYLYGVRFEIIMIEHTFLLQSLYDIQQQMQHALKKKNKSKYTKYHHRYQIVQEQLRTHWMYYERTNSHPTIIHGFLLK